MTRLIIDINGAAFHPTHNAAFHPTHDAAFHPTNDASLHPTSDASIHAGSSNGASQVLLTEALRASRAALVREGDLKAKPEVTARIRSNDLKLWRWEASYRQEACLFELLSQLRFEGGTLWHVPCLAEPKEGDGQLSEPAFRMLSITLPDKDATMLAQAKLVLKRTPERGDRMAEILIQADDLWPFWTSVTGFDPLTAPFTHELLQLALRFETSVVMRMKHELACARPAEVSNAIQPVIRTPGHASLPSGHATVAFMMARLLERILSTDATTSTQLKRLAHRVADNRTVAGLHYPMDTAAGRLLGTTLANCFLSACNGDEYAFKAADFDGKCIDGLALEDVEGDSTKLVEKIFDTATEDNLPKPARWKGGPRSLVKQMWEASHRELQALRYLMPELGPTAADSR